MSKWGKNYSKPTKSFKKACLMNSLRGELSLKTGIPFSLLFSSRNEDKYILDSCNIAQQKMNEDLKEMKKIGIQFADSLPRKAKKRFKKGLSIRKDELWNQKVLEK